MMKEFPTEPGLYWVRYPLKPDDFELIEIPDTEETGGEEGYLLLGEAGLHDPEEIMSEPVEFFPAEPPF